MTIHKHTVSMRCRQNSSRSENLTYLLGGRSTLCFRSSVWKRLKLKFALFNSVLDAASSENMVTIIDINVEVCLASKADLLQNLKGD